MSHSEYGALSGIFELLDIESLFGPNWSKQVEDICAVLGEGDMHACTMIREFPVGVIAGGDIYGASEVGVD